MKLSDDKVNHIAHIVANVLEKEEKLTLLKDKNTVRLKIREVITTELQIDDAIDLVVRASIPNKIREGSRQWDIEYTKLFEQELAKRGRS